MLNYRHPLLKDQVPLSDTKWRTTYNIYRNCVTVHSTHITIFRTKKCPKWTPAWWLWFYLYDSSVQCCWYNRSQSHSMVGPEEWAETTALATEEAMLSCPSHSWVPSLNAGSECEQLLKQVGCETRNVCIINNTYRRAQVIVRLTTQHCEHTYINGHPILHMQMYMHIYI